MRFIEVTDGMAYELYKVVAGHPMNCQCEVDKLLREYQSHKVSLPGAIVAGETKPKGLARLSSVWKWLVSLTPRSGNAHN